MPLRLKILALASVLLVAFAITTALSAYYIREVMDELGSVVEHHIVLTALVSEVDALTFEHELNVRRLLEAAGDAERRGAIVARQAELAARLPKIFEQVKTTLATAVDDPRSDPSDRVRFARVDGTVALLGRQVPTSRRCGKRSRSSPGTPRARPRCTSATRLEAGERQQGLRHRHHRG
jgi:predicted RNA-binding Zn ribbon-like protein